MLGSVAVLGARIEGSGAGAAMGDRNYWAGYWIEQFRLDARRNCSTGYSCGSTCISLKKECKKSAASSIGKERLKKITAIASGTAPEGLGLQRVKTTEAAAIATEIQQRRSRRAGELQGQRPERTAVAKGPSMGDRLVSQPGATVSPRKLDEAFDSLEAVGGEVGENVRNLRQFFANQNGAIVFGKEGSLGNWLMGSPKLLRAIDTAESEANALFSRMVGDRARAYRQAISAPRTIKTQSDLDEILPQKRGDGHYWPGQNFITAKDIGTVQIDYAPGGKALADAVDASVRQRGLPEYVGYPKDSKRSRLDAMTLVIIHELGHMVHSKGSTRAAQRTHSADMAPPEVERERAASKYGKVDNEERFAEAFVAFTLAPDALRKTRPETYKWIKATFEKARASS